MCLYNISFVPSFIFYVTNFIPNPLKESRDIPGTISDGQWHTLAFKRLSKTSALFTLDQISHLLEFSGVPSFTEEFSRVQMYIAARPFKPGF